MLNKNGLLNSNRDNFPYNGYIVSGGSLEIGYGYKAGEYGELYGNIGFFDTFEAYPYGEGLIVFISSLFKGKPENDGNVAHLYECEIISDIYSGKGFLIPDYLKETLDPGVTKYTYPGDHYVFMSDVPDRILFLGKEDEVVNSMPLEFPHKKTEKTISAHMWATFMKGDVVVKKSDLTLSDDMFFVSKAFSIGDKCNISMRIPPLTGRGYLTKCIRASNRSLFREAA